MLVLNAGVTAFGRFIDMNYEEIQQDANVNTLHVLFTARILAAKMAQRHKDTGLKSGILVTSSGYSLVPCGGVLPFSCSKAFVSFLARGLNIEL